MVAGSGTAVTLPAPVSTKVKTPVLAKLAKLAIPRAVAVPMVLLKMPVPPLRKSCWLKGTLPSGSGALRSVSKERRGFK